MDRGNPESPRQPELSLGTPSPEDGEQGPGGSDSASDDPPRGPTIFEFDDAQGDRRDAEAPDGDGGEENSRSADAREESPRDVDEEESPRAATEGAGPHDPLDAPEAEPDPDADDDTASHQLFERAKADWRDGHDEAALNTYRRLVAMNPAHLRARNNLGVLLDQTGAHEAALEHFQAALEIEPENPEVLTNYGAALASLGRYGEAEAQLRRAMRIEPGRVDVRANLGILFFRRGLYAQSESELRWVCEQDPEHATAHFYRGEALNRLGRVDEALETLERASHLQPDRPRIYYLLGILYDRKHLSHEAGLMYRKARELSNR